MPHEYPEVHRGGSLMLAWQVRGRHVLVVGGGDVSFPPIANYASFPVVSRNTELTKGFRLLQVESSMSSMPMQRSPSFRPEMGSTQR